MPKIPKSRSLSHVRTYLIYLGTALQVREATHHLAGQVLQAVKKCDEGLAELRAADDDHVRAMAMLRAAVTDCQLCVSALWTQTGILDRLHLEWDVEHQLFPQGVTLFTRKSGTGFEQALAPMKELLEACGRAPWADDLRELREQLEQERETVSLRLTFEAESLARKHEVYASNDALKFEIDELLIDIESALKKLFRRNRKVVASFFK